MATKQDHDVKTKTPPNPQTIASLHDGGLTLSGWCWGCKPARLVRISMRELVAAKGPDFLVRHAIKRISCKECGAPLDLNVTPDRPPSFAYPKADISPRSDHYKPSIG